MVGKVRIEKRCLCGKYIKTGALTKSEADLLGRKWTHLHSGPGHRALSEEAFKKMFGEVEPTEGTD